MDWVDPGHAINSAAHAGTIIKLRWPNDPDVVEWTKSSIRKVICEITHQQFECLKQFDDYEIITELAFDGKEIGLIFKPRKEWPKYFNYLKLWGREMLNRKVLTKNVKFFVECVNEECIGDHTKIKIDLYDIFEDRYPYCKICDQKMKIDNECIIEN